MSARRFAEQGVPAAEGPEYDSQPELGLAAVLYLLSRFPARRSSAVAQSIVWHLELLSGDPRLAPCLRECAARLVGDWRSYALLGDAGGNQEHGGPLH